MFILDRILNFDYVVNHLILDVDARLGLYEFRGLLTFKLKVEVLLICSHLGLDDAEFTLMASFA